MTKCRCNSYTPQYKKYLNNVARDRFQRQAEEQLLRNQLQAWRDRTDQSTQYSEYLSRQRYLSDQVHAAVMVIANNMHF
jgi:hypothetical protein